MKSAFLSTISHELNTPLHHDRGFHLNPPRGYQGFNDLKTRQEFYQIVDAECERLSRLIGDLLSLSRIQSRAARLTLAPVISPRWWERVVETQRAYVCQAHPARRSLSQASSHSRRRGKIEQVLNQPRQQRDQILTWRRRGPGQVTPKTMGSRLGA